MSEKGPNATHTTVRGAAVRIEVSQEFYDLCAAAGNVALWPEKTAAQIGPTTDGTGRYWLFAFETEESAEDFAAASQARVIEAKRRLGWED